MKISKAVRKVRAAAGLTQKQLAKKMGVSPSTVAGWELGTHSPRMSRINKLARIVGCEIADLVGGRA